MARRIFSDYLTKVHVPSKRLVLDQLPVIKLYRWIKSNSTLGTMSSVTFSSHSPELCACTPVLYVGGLTKPHLGLSDSPGVAR